MGVSCLQGIDPSGYRAHSLHDARRNWPETNCYVDLWIEVLHAMGLEPEAALGFTVTQDFEGDQFTFFKFPPEDLQRLFGLGVQELAIYDRVETHALEQLHRGRLVLVEVDSFFLPDTRGVSYRVTHGKTTIGVNYLDVQARQLHYFHNAGYFQLSGEDYEGIFGAPAAATLFPYVEFVKIDPRPPQTVRAGANALLREHLRGRPDSNPLRAFRQAFAQQLPQLADRPMEFFHLYAFNTLRQLGANFELLGSHLAWLDGAAAGQTLACCEQLASGAKVLQFQLARAMSRKRFDGLEGGIEALADAYDRLMTELGSRYS